ncbi:Tricorn protease domain-containing protein [Photobacterium galatheae]|nr:Tricorn protease domain-containing protein [Photobacterium galatheae]
MKRKIILSVVAAILISGCEQETMTSSNTEHDLAEQSTTFDSTPDKPMSIVEQKNAQHWDDGRIYITEHNYISYQNNNGKPKYYVFKAKEWPREDLNNKSSYDLPRVVFRWDNGEGETDDYYERKDKVWSIKTDGTDLRLVADEFDGSVRAMRMSPNNRYLALGYWADSGVHKVIKDLKTGEYIDLGKEYGFPNFLWSETSDYLYFFENRKTYKYNIQEKSITEVDVQFNKDSVIYDGKRFVVNKHGVAVYNEGNNKLLYSVSVDLNSKQLEKFVFKEKGISPGGKYAWGESSEYRFLIDVNNRKIYQEKIDLSKPGDYEMLNILSLDAKFARSGGSAQVFLFSLDEEKRIKKSQVWKQIGTGHSATESSLYNAFANNGSFEK